MAGFSSQPFAPRSKRYHDIEVSRVKEMLLEGRYHTFAYFWEEIDYYEKSKNQFLYAHNTYMNARIGLESSLECFHGWINHQAEPLYNVYPSNQG